MGEIITERLIINGTFEGICRATYIEILSCGRVSGTIYSDNLSIEPGGKFMGITNPCETIEVAPKKQKNLDEKALETLKVETKKPNNHNEKTLGSHNLNHKAPFADAHKKTDKDMQH